MLSLNGEDFEDYMDKQDAPFVVLVHADWCGPCQRFKPQFVRSSLVNTDYEHVMANADTLPDLMSEWKIMSVPTAALIHYGRIVHTITSRTAETIGTELSAL